MGRTRCGRGGDPYGVCEAQERFRFAHRPLFLPRSQIEAASSKVADESEERRKDALEAGLPASGEAVITDSRQKEPLDLSWLLLSLDRKFSRRACRSCRRTAEAGGGPGAATPSVERTQRRSTIFASPCARRCMRLRSDALSLSLSTSVPKSR